MLSRSQKRFVLFAAILVVIVLFVVPFINVTRYRSTVANSLSASLGRKVSIQDVSLQTFPEPGLLLKGVVVSDDPSISAEPILHAEEVLATIRVTSLWRGRLEIGKLKFQYASMNIVRAADGRWNLSSLLERARQTPVAPTANRRPESRQRFPYIESKGGRINLKIGQAKTVFALNDANFQVWLAAEDEWRMRLEARPIRTDSNLSDTGTVKMEGTWRRASVLTETPLSLKVSWEDAQLGQLTSLIYGRDRGWRGGVHVSAEITGRADYPHLVTDIRVDDFRRYDIATRESLSLQAHCQAEYHFHDKEVDNFTCRSPIGDGVLLAAGSFGVPPYRHDLNLDFSSERIPAQFLAVLARHMKQNIPADLALSGLATAAFHVNSSRDRDSKQWSGSAETSLMRISASTLSKPLVVEPTKWHLVGPGTGEITTVSSRKKSTKPKDDMPLPAASAWRLDPVSLSLGGAAPAVFTGWFSRGSGYYSRLSGEADLSRVFELAHTFGITAPDSDLDGTARGALQISGTWPDFAAPAITADAQLRGVTARISGVASPLRIASAHLVVTPQATSLTTSSATLAGLHSQLGITANWTRGCSPDSTDCGLKFDLQADQLNLDEINSLLNPKAQRQPWYATLANSVIGSDRRNLPEIHATGRVVAQKLIVKDIIANRFNSTVTIAPGTLEVTNITADVFGGKYSGTIQGDFTSNPPAYVSTGKLQHVVLANVSSTMRDSWASGSLDASYHGKASGWTADDLGPSASGNATFDWHDGTLHHVDLEANGKPLQFKRFSGTMELKSGVLLLSQSKLETPHGIYSVSGTASLGRQLGLQLARRGTPEFSVSGTLENPKVAPVKAPEAQASLR